MGSNRFTKEEAASCEEALKEVMDGMSKRKVAEFIGHFNDLFLFLTAAKEAAPKAK